MEDEDYQFESNLEEEDYGIEESSEESVEEIVDYEGMKNALELFCFNRFVLDLSVSAAHLCVVRYREGSTGKRSGSSRIRAENRERSQCCFKGVGCRLYC